MLWMLLSCTLGYQEDDGLKSISVEQTHTVHHYNYDKAIKSSLRILSLTFYRILLQSYIELRAFYRLCRKRIGLDWQGEISFYLLNLF